MELRDLKTTVESLHWTSRVVRTDAESEITTRCERFSQGRDALCDGIADIATAMEFRRETGQK